MLINLNKDKINYLYDTEEVKIIRLELTSKWAEQWMLGDLYNGNEELTLMGTVPTGYNPLVDLTSEGKELIYIELLEGYNLCGYYVDKYSVKLTLTKGELW